MRRIGVLSIVVAALIAALLWGNADHETESLTRPALVPGASVEARGAAAFEGAGFGGISMDALATNAVPWRLVAAALVLDEHARDLDASLDRNTLDKVMARFGFLTNATIANAPPGVVQPRSDLPIGFTTGDIAPVGGTRVRLANLGCAACHAGVSYSADGEPQPHRAMLGMPNSSIDLEAYTLAVFRATRRFADSDRLLPTANTLFPQMSFSERASLRFLVLPLAKRRLRELATVDRPLSFPNGAPGSTNGVAALKAALGVPLIGGGKDDAGVVSIPDLADRVWKTSLLADGAYAVPGTSRQSVISTADLDARHLRALAAITTFFTVPSMGVHPDDAIGSLDDATSIMAFLKAYRPQHIPIPVVPAEAKRGAIIYAANCATCHGSYGGTPTALRLARFPNWIGNVGTDRLRATVFDRALAARVGKTVYRDRISVAVGRGYVAPPLSGIWASAPYLHNGSVPTLAALLSPDTRLRRFMVGGHALDFDRVGLRLQSNGSYPKDYRPFSSPVWIDTSAPGRGNQGHRFGESLSPNDKRALLSYLKLL